MGESPEELGPYVIYERLGAGGMATVHRAEHVGVAGFRRAIALKRLLPHVADDPAMLEMFIHEARLASQLRHANVAATYDLGKVDETYFIAMEYVPGPTLTQIMKQCGTVTGPMPVPIALTILQQLLDALDHAHNLNDDMGRALGIIHRDISPSNIIVSTAGIVKLIDFGIAKAATGGVHTQTGMIKGKYAYIAPEYMQGHLDSRADLFGVGIIAHELLSTKRLFNAASDYETLERLRAMPITEPSLVNKEVPPDLDDIVLTALQRDPEQRWQSASAMRTALTNVSRSIKGGIVTSQQLTEWVERTFAQQTRNPPVMPTGLARVIDTLDDSGDGDDDMTRARHVDRDDSASDAADPTIPPPAPATRARTRLGRVTQDPPMDPYETMTGDVPAPKKWPAEKPRSQPNIVRPVPKRALSEEETPAPDLAARAKMLASRTAQLAAKSRSAQIIAQKPLDDTDTASIDDSMDTSEQTGDASADQTLNRVLQPAKIGGLTSPASRNTPPKEPKKRRLDASEYEIEMERTDDSVVATVPPALRAPVVAARPTPPPRAPAPVRPPLPTSAESPAALPRRAPRPSTKELSPRDRLSMQLTVDEDAETPEPVRVSPPPPRPEKPLSPTSDTSLDQALGSLDTALDETKPRERESIESMATLARAPVPASPVAARAAHAASVGGSPSRSVGGKPSATGSGGLPPQRDSPMPLGSPPTPPPRNAGSAPNVPFGGPPAMPGAMPASGPLPPPTGVINPSADGARTSSPSRPPPGVFPPAQHSANAFAPVAPTIVVAPAPSSSPVINPSANVINPSAPFNPSANRGSDPPSQNRGSNPPPQNRGSAPSQPPPMANQMIGASLAAAAGAPPSSPHATTLPPGASPHAATQVINPSAPVINPSAPYMPPRPGPSQAPPFVASQLVVPTSMPLGPSSVVAERAALIPSLPQRAAPPLVSARPSAPNAKTIVAGVNPLAPPIAPTAAAASTIIADVGSIPPIVPRVTDAQINAAIGPAHATSIGSMSAAERAALDRVTPSNRATLVEAVPPLVSVKTAPMDERARRPSQQPEQNFARALVLPDAPPVAVFPAGEDSGEMLVAPGAASKQRVEDEKPVEEKRDKNVVIPAAPDGPARWPWFLLVVVLLAVGAGAYVYFFGFDLPYL